MFIEQQKTKYDLNFSLFDIPICVHPFFWLIAVALGWTADSTPAELGIWVLCVFSSILIHELGHGLAAKRFGGRGSGVHIELNGMGGVTKFSANLDKKERIIELICGPFSGFVLFFLALLLTKLSPNSSPYLLHFGLRQLMYINLIWGLLNLLPIYPLDGGQIMKEIILIKRPWDAVEKTFKVSMLLSAGVSVIFLVSTLFSLFANQGASWIPVLVFAGLAIMNYHFLKGTLGREGAFGHGKPQMPWERESDWWKK